MPEPILTEINGVKEWRLNNLLHREDGPACEYNDGKTDWYVDGKKIENPKEFIIQYLSIFECLVISMFYRVYSCKQIKFDVFAKVFHQLAKENLISVIKIRNKKTDFIDYIAVSNNFEVI